MTAIEAVAAILILGNSLLLVRRSIWNFPVGIAGVAVYGWIFWQSRLYSDMLLQGFFAVVQTYGWWNWSQTKTALGSVVIERMTLAARGLTVIAIGTAAASWGWLMHRFTDAAAPWLDAGVAMTSVAAQILLTRRKLENWVLWIVVNIMSVALYASRGLYVTFALYCVMLALSVWSLFVWARAEREQGLAAAAPAR